MLMIKHLYERPLGKRIIVRREVDMIPVESINSMIDALLKMSDRAFDDSMKVLVRKWDSPPTSVQLLEVIDKCVYSSLTSSAVLYALQVLYDDTVKREGTTHDEVVKKATWRDKH